MYFANFYDTIELQQRTSFQGIIKDFMIDSLMWDLQEAHMSVAISLANTCHINLNSEVCSGFAFIQ